MRKVLAKIWQGDLTPQQGLEDLLESCAELGDVNGDVNKEQRILDILSAVAAKELTVNEAEQTLREEGFKHENKNFRCQT